MKRQFTPVRPRTRASDTSTLRRPLLQPGRSCEVPCSTSVVRALRCTLPPVPSTPGRCSVVIGGRLSVQPGGVSGGVTGGMTGGGFSVGGVSPGGCSTRGVGGAGCGGGRRPVLRRGGEPPGVAPPAGGGGGAEPLGPAPPGGRR